MHFSCELIIVALLKRPMYYRDKILSKMLSLGQKSEAVCSLNIIL